MRTRRIVLLVLIAASAIALFAAAVRHLTTPVVSTVPAARSDLEQRVLASGRVRVTTPVQLAAQTSGRVVLVNAREGARVKAGDLLVGVDDADARAALNQADAAVQQAQARLAQNDAVNAPVAAENARQAETLLAQARADLTRLESLAEAGAVAAREVEDARRAVAIAEARRRAAAAGETATIDSGAERRLAEAALAESRARRAAADVRLAQTRIEAPHDGVVLARHVETGDIVQPGTIVLDLAADAAIEVVIEPDERNLGWIRTGQRARLAADAYPDVPFDAEVTYIAPAVDPRRGSIEVRLTVADPPSFLKPHMTVSVDLAVATRHAVLTLPTPAVRGGGAEPWVFVVDDGRLVRRMVTIGLRGDGHTEIVDGLREGDEVVLPGERRLDPGTRVRPERVAR